MGVLPEREWIMRAPTLQRKLALTAKVQDEVGHAQLLYRVAEDLGKPREAMIQDLLDGKTKFHNVFHYPTKTWADIGVIAWLVDAAAIVAQQALRDSSYAPVRPDDEEDLLGGVGPHHARPRRRGDDGDRHRGAAATAPGGARPLVGPAHADARPARRPSEGPRPPLADQGEDVRGAAPGVPLDLRAADLGAGPDPARPGAAPRRGDRRVALHRARLAGAAHGRHGPRPQVPGAARVPAHEPGPDAVGPRHDPRVARGAPSRDGPAPRRPRHGRRGRPRPLEPWEVFRQEKEGDPMRHGGIGHGARRRPRHPLRPRDVQPPPGERPPVGRPAGRHPRPRRSGPAPAAARPLVQEAGRLRDARQARRRPEQSGQAEAAKARRRPTDDATKLRQPPARSQPTTVFPAVELRRATPSTSCCCPWPTTSSSSASRTPSGPASRRCSRRTSR